MKKYLNLFLFFWVILAFSMFLMDAMSYYEVFGFPDDFQMINRNMNLSFIYPFFMIPLLGTMIYLGLSHNKFIDEKNKPNPDTKTLVVRRLFDRKPIEIEVPKEKTWNRNEIEPLLENISAYTHVHNRPVVGQEFQNWAKEHLS